MASVAGRQKGELVRRTPRENVVHVRMDDADLAALDACAAKANLTRSAFLRSCIGSGGSQARRVRCAGMDASASELRKASSSLRQIERRVRMTSGHYDAGAELAAVARAIEKASASLIGIANAHGLELQMGMSGPSPAFDGEVLAP